MNDFIYNRSGNIKKGIKSKQVEINQYINKYQKQETCINCGSNCKIIKSHTIPKVHLKNIQGITNNQSYVINNRYGFFYNAIDARSFDIKYLLRRERFTGIGEILTFNRLCNKCDTDLFRPFEYMKPNDWTKKLSDDVIRSLVLKMQLAEIYFLQLSLNVINDVIINEKTLATFHGSTLLKTLKRAVGQNSNHISKYNMTIKEIFNFSFPFAMFDIQVISPPGTVTPNPKHLVYRYLAPIGDGRSIMIEICNDKNKTHINNTNELKQYFDKNDILDYMLDSALERKINTLVYSPTMKLFISNRNIKLQNKLELFNNIDNNINKKYVSND